MNRKIAALSMLAALLLFAAVFARAANNVQAVNYRPTLTPSQTLPTYTPTGYLGVYTIRGAVHDSASGLPLAGVEVGYGHIFYIEVPQPPGEMTQTLTDGEGRYTLGPVALRDTDTLTIYAETEGYTPQQIRLTGLDVYSGRRDNIDFALEISATLTPSPSPTVTPTQTPTQPPNLTLTTATPTVDLTRHTATPSFTPTRAPSHTPTPDLTRTTATPTANLTKTTATPSPTATPT